MSDELNNNAGDQPFDLEKLQHLMELMEKHGLTELHLKNAGQVWRLRRGPETITVAPQPVYSPPPAMPTQTPQPVQPTGGTGGEVAPAPVAESGVLIKSPTVGTFYAAPSPDDPPFVTVGSKIQPDTIVCLVEAMKVYNDIQAEVAGTITSILVKNGDAVEYDQPLFRVEPA